MMHFAAQTGAVKPENAYKKAEELARVGEKGGALDVLHNLITSRKNYSKTWQPIMEKIFLRHIELGTELKKSRMVKEALHQYRTLTLNSNVASLETVIRAYLELAEKEADAAQKVAGQAVVDAVGDLDEDETPESLFLLTVGDEKDRGSRMIVTPRLKFLWEAHRTVLDVLRYNTRLESLYQRSARAAFQFCIKYKRSVEFRRVCETLRTHLAAVQRPRSPAVPVQNASEQASPEMLEGHLQTLFVQLNAAAELELWQEAFRSIEDIHGVLEVSKLPPKVELLRNYSLKLQTIFWVSENYLFHCFALYKSFCVSRDSLSAAERASLVSKLFCSAMAVPAVEPCVTLNSFDYDNSREKALRMATLLGFNFAEPFEVVLSGQAPGWLDAFSNYFLGEVVQPVRDLYRLIQVEFDPLKLVQRCAPLFRELEENEDLMMYVPRMKRLMLLRLLQQCEKVYEKMEYKNFLSLAPGFAFEEVEDVVLEAVKHNHVQCKVDHMASLLVFRGNSVDASDLGKHLSVFAKKVHGAAKMIRPPGPAPSKLPSVVLGAIVDEHEKVLQRRGIIERRKEEHEEKLREQALEHDRRIASLQREREDVEMKRRAEEAQKREKERLQREAHERELQETRILALEVERRKGVKGTTTKMLDDIDSANSLEVRRSLMAEQRQLLEKEKMEIEKKMVATAKRLDHLERARAQENAKLRVQWYDRWRKECREHFERQVREYVESLKKAHVNDLSEKTRLVRVLDDRRTFEESRLQKRRELLERQREDRLVKLKEMREARKKERAERKRLDQARKKREREEAEQRAIAQREEDLRLRKEVNERREYGERLARERRAEEEALEEQQEQELVSRRDQSRRSPVDSEWSRGQVSDRREPVSERREQGWEDRAVDRRDRMYAATSEFSRRSEPRERSSGDWRNDAQRSVVEPRGVASREELRAGAPDASEQKSPAEVDDGFQPVKSRRRK